MGMPVSNWIEGTRDDKKPVELLTRESNLAAPSTMDKANRRVRASIASEDPVLVMDRDNWEPIEEILTCDGCRSEQQIPLLIDHRQYSVTNIFGSVTDVRQIGSTLDAQIEFGRDLDEMSEAIWKRVEQGHLRKLSVGYRYDRNSYIDIAPGKTATIGNQSYTAKGNRRLRVVTDWRLMEVSLVVFPADAKAQLRENDNRTDGNKSQEFSNQSSVENNSSSQGQKMNPIILFLRKFGLPQTVNDTAAALAWYSERQEQFDAANQAEMKRLADVANLTIPVSSSQGEGQRNATIVPPVAPPATTQTQTIGRTAEQESARQRSIRDMADLSGNVPDSLVRELCDDMNVTADQARERMLAHVRTSRATPAPPLQHAPAGHVRGGQITERSLQLALAMRHGVNLDSPAYTQPNVRQALTRGYSGSQFNNRHIVGLASDLRSRGIPRAESANELQFAREYDQAVSMIGMSNRDFCRHLLELNGLPVSYDPEEMFRSAMSVGNFEAILSSVVHLIVLEGFESEMNTYSSWVYETDVPDFRDNKRARMGGVDGLKKLAKNGGTAAILNSEEPEVESYAIDRFAGQMIFDDRFLTDDSFGIADYSAQQIGMKAAKIPSDLVYAKLLLNAAMSDTVAFFHASRSNLTDKTLDFAGLRFMKNAMPKVTGPNGEPTNVQMTTILADTNLALEANRLVGSANLQTTTSVTDKAEMNPFFNQFRVIEESKLGTGCVNPDTGQFVSGLPLRWYGLGNRNYRAMELGWLAGTGRRPRIRRSQLTQGQWGLHLDIVIDCGAKLLTPESMSASDQAS